MKYQIDFTFSRLSSGSTIIEADSLAQAKLLAEDIDPANSDIAWHPIYVAVDIDEVKQIEE